MSGSCCWFGNLQTIDVSGRQVKKFAANISENEIDLSALANGIYLLNIQVDSKSVQTNKLVIVH